MDYCTFFTRATEYPPYPYQHRLAEGDCPDLLHIPTGLGKTNAIIVAWLYWHFCRRENTPRRLVYTLPMRVLVEQVFSNIRQCLENLAPIFEEAGVALPKVYLMMGGDVDERWQGEPEQCSILVGTQDMLVSRALNRGYAMSRYRWPMQFAMLHNDAMWVFDEPQLMGVTVETSAQLKGFREHFGTFGPHHTIWASATLERSQMDTVDHRNLEPLHVLELDEADLSQESVQTRILAKKEVCNAPLFRLDSKTKKSYAKDVSSAVLDIRKKGEFTLVIVNRVQRAKDLYTAFLKDKERTIDNTLLIHSRFRPHERSHIQKTLFEQVEKGTDLVVVATQAVEAGVDISANRLVTELAPWPSIVQRLGRCNRKGEFESGSVHWIDLDEDKDVIALPYYDGTDETAGMLAASREFLANLDDASPDVLRQIAYQSPFVQRSILRKKDLVQLFDSTQDLLGNDIDIAHFIRDQRDTDAKIFWRDWSLGEREELQAITHPHRDELCSVPIGECKAFIERLRKADSFLWRWDALESRWVPVLNSKDCRPGLILLAHSSFGGYDEALGWTGTLAKGKQNCVSIVPDNASSAPFSNDSMGADPGALDPSPTPRWVPLQEHLGDVEEAVRGLSLSLDLPDEFISCLATAGAWHDVGKGHPAFQQKLRQSCPEYPPPSDDECYAKSPAMRPVPLYKQVRPYFRHELASALAWLAASASDQDSFTRDLIAYLVMSHHGKIRLAIKALPQEKQRVENGELMLSARGVYDGETLSPVTLPDGTVIEPQPLDLSIMQMGRGSWVERTLALRDHQKLGPFRLAFLELVLRAADWRASREAFKMSEPPPHVSLPNTEETKSEQMSLLSFSTSDLSGK